jgi:hypothetical protein
MGRISKGKKGEVGTIKMFASRRKERYIKSLGAGGVHMGVQNQ